MATSTGHQWHKITTTPRGQLDRTNLLVKGFYRRNPPVLQQVQQVTTFSADAGGGTPQNTYNPIGRLDFNMTDKTQMYGRYVLFNDDHASGAG